VTVTVSTIPAYPSVNEKVTLIGTSDAYQDDDVEFSLSSVPRESKLALGLVTERHANVARSTSIAVTFVARKDLARIVPAAITRTSGSFVVDGFKPGMVLDITGATTAANNKRVTIAKVTTKELTVSVASTFTAESGTVSLVGGVYGDSPATNTITFDKPGEYTVSAAEHFVWPGIGAGYNGDPLGVPQKRLMSTTTATIYVGDHLDLPIEPVNGHGSTLRIFVVNETVRGAELVNPKTDLARVAALDSTVAAAVSALEGVALNSLEAASLVADVNTLATAFEAHRIRTSGSVHNSADTTNALLREIANSTPAAIDRLNDMTSKIIGHQQALSSGGLWHNSDDGKNVLQVAPSAKTLGQAVVLKADLWERVYRRHVAQTASPPSHTSADATNDVTPVVSGSLSYAIVQYLDFIASSAPSIPAGESEGIGDAQAAWGFGRAA
jgi:hypothetical protein